MSILIHGREGRGIGVIVEYGIGFNSKHELVVIEFNRTTGEMKYIPLVVVDGKVVIAAEEVKH